MPKKMPTDQEKAAIKLSRRVVLASLFLVIGMGVIISIAFRALELDKRDGYIACATVVINPPSLNLKPAQNWQAPNINTIPPGKNGDMIRYGRELLTHTALYFGPKGSIARISNGMNCQNCHLRAGTQLFGNNYAGFIASYPKLSNRSGKYNPPAARITECFERSMAGKAPDTSGKEVRAMLAYLEWLGKDVKKGQKLYGSSVEKLPFMAVAASAAKGQVVYAAKCQSCHGANGAGIFAAGKKSYTYPPLWGKYSYNDGAGMYRIGNLAGFVKNNMPYGVTYKNPQLTDEQAWNVAAFVNSQPRPHRDQHTDWPDLNTKPIDFPFGPYADHFSERQHKYGPFKPIIAAQKPQTTTKT